MDNMPDWLVELMASRGQGPNLPNPGVANPWGAPPSAPGQPYSGATYLPHLPGPASPNVPGFGGGIQQQGDMAAAGNPQYAAARAPFSSTLATPQGQSFASQNISGFPGIELNRQSPAGMEAFYNSALNRGAATPGMSLGGTFSNTGTGPGGGFWPGINGQGRLTIDPTHNSSLSPTVNPQTNVSRDYYGGARNPVVGNPILQAQSMGALMNSASGSPVGGPINDNGSLAKGATNVIPPSRFGETFSRNPAFGNSPQASTAPGAGGGLPSGVPPIPFQTAQGLPPPLQAPTQPAAQTAMNQPRQMAGIGPAPSILQGQWPPPSPGATPGANPMAGAMPAAPPQMPTPPPPSFGGQGFGGGAPMPPPPPMPQPGAQAARFSPMGPPGQSMQGPMPPPPGLSPQATHGSVNWAGFPQNQQQNAPPPPLPPTPVQGPGGSAGGMGGGPGGYGGPGQMPFNQATPPPPTAAPGLSPQATHGSVNWADFPKPPTPQMAPGQQIPFQGIGGLDPFAGAGLDVGAAGGIVDVGGGGFAGGM